MSTTLRPAKKKGKERKREKKQREEKTNKSWLPKNHSKLGPMELCLLTRKGSANKANLSVNCLGARMPLQFNHQSNTLATSWGIPLLI
jgi:hypothetical protein